MYSMFCLDFGQVTHHIRCLQHGGTVFYIFCLYLGQVTGYAGAGNIAALLEKRGVKQLEFVLDEGLTVFSGIMQGLDVPAAL